MPSTKAPHERPHPGARRRRPARLCRGRGIPRRRLEREGPGAARPRRRGAAPGRGDRGGDARRGDRGGAAAATSCSTRSIRRSPNGGKNALSLAYGAIAAAEGNGATLLFPGSVWNYGRGMPPVLDESTPMQPTTRKGAMRVEIEQRIQEACDRGMRAIMLRAGDFFGGGSGSWFDLVIAKDIERSRLDLSRAARRRARLGLSAGLRGDAGAARGAARELRAIRDASDFPAMR